MKIEDAVEIQKAWGTLKSGRFTKKMMCDILVPLRDKFGLTDLQTLQVARNELSLEQIFLIETKPQGKGEKDE